MYTQKSTRRFCCKSSCVANVHLATRQREVSSGSCGVCTIVGIFEGLYSIASGEGLHCNVMRHFDGHLTVCPLEVDVNAVDFV